MDVTLTINGFNFAPVLSTYLTVYETDYGKTVKALDGTEYTGNFTSRPVVTFSLFPMTDATAQHYYNALTSSIPAVVTYTDKATNTDRTGQMRVTSNLEFTFGLRSVDGNRYYKGGAITLRAVHCLGASVTPVTPTGIEASVSNSVLILKGSGASVSGNRLNLASDNVSVSGDTLTFETR